MLSPLNRKHNVPVDFDAYIAWRAQQASQPFLNGYVPPQSACQSSPNNSLATSSTVVEGDLAGSTSSQTREPPAPYPTSFSQIVDLITTGQPIPGVKQVPDTLLAGQESQPTTAKRKKPWEQGDIGNVDEMSERTIVRTAPS